MKKRKLIPFRYMPSSWGLNGKSYKLAEIDYYYEGKERDVLELALNSNKDSNEYKLKNNDILFQYEEITEEEHQYNRLDILFDSSSDEYKKERLKLDKQYSKITNDEYDKNIANLNNQEYCKIISANLEPDSLGNVRLKFELDWNTNFINQLKDAGFDGYSEDDIINKWFERVANDILINSQEEKDNGELSSYITSFNRTKINQKNDGTTEYE